MWSNTRIALLKLTIGLLLLGITIEFLAIKFSLPHLGTILLGAKTLWIQGTLKHDVLVSSARWGIGWSIGGSLGVILGLLTGRVKSLRILFEGSFILLRSIPFISLVPLCLRIFGLSESGKIFLVAWASTGICWVVVHQATQNIPQQIIWRSISLGASRKKWIFQVLLPSCREGIIAGLRASLSIGLIVIAVAEMSGVYESSSGRWWSEGLGYRLSRTLDQSRDDWMMASILTFALLGIVVDQLFLGVSNLLDYLSFYWKRKRVFRVIHQAKQLPKQEDSRVLSPSPLDVAHLHAGYDQKVVISELSFQIPAGTTMSVVGPSGCGKTTLVRALGHFMDDKFSVSGNVKVGDTSIEKAGSWTGVVLQDSPVFNHMTVWDNVTFGDRFNQLSPSETNSIAYNLLIEFGLEHLAAEKADTLSGGQRQRLAFATALANQPQILLLDEPFGALDAITRRQLQFFYWQHVHGKITAVFVTHDLEEALIIGDNVRVGVAPNATVIPVDKEGIPPHDWELEKGFLDRRATLIAALENA